MKNSILLIVFVMLVAACSEIGPDLQFISDGTSKLTISGKEILRYAADSCQLEHNTTTNEFAVIKDDGSDYLIAVLDKCPSESGTEVNATISWLWGKEYSGNKNMVFNTEKVEDHTIWLWNKTTRTGLVLKCLE